MLPSNSFVPPLKISAQHNRKELVENTKQAMLHYNTHKQLKLAAGDREPGISKRSHRGWINAYTLMMMMMMIAHRTKPLPVKPRCTFSRCNMKCSSTWKWFYLPCDPNTALSTNNNYVHVGFGSSIQARCRRHSSQSPSQGECLCYEFTHFSHVLYCQQSKLAEATNRTRIPK